MGKLLFDFELEAALECRLPSLSVALIGRVYLKLGVLILFPPPPLPDDEFTSRRTLAWPKNELIFSSWYLLILEFIFDW